MIYSTDRILSTHAGYNYPKGCYIGERMRGFISDES